MEATRATRSAAATSGLNSCTVGVLGLPAGLASTACPATLNTAGRSSSRISSSTAPPTTCRVTTNGLPGSATTFAAIATPSRAAR